MFPPFCVKIPSYREGGGDVFWAIHPSKLPNTILPLNDRSRVVPVATCRYHISCVGRATSQPAVASSWLLIGWQLLSGGQPPDPEDRGSNRDARVNAFFPRFSITLHRKLMRKHLPLFSARPSIDTRIIIGRVGGKVMNSCCSEKYKFYFFLI